MRINLPAIFLAVLLYFIPVRLLAQTPQPEQQPSKWKATGSMPTICVVKVDEQTAAGFVSVELPMPEQQTVTETYTVRVPVTAPDGTPKLTEETRQRVVPRTIFTMKRHELRLDEVSFHNLDGVEIPRATVQQQLRIPRHVIYGDIPDLYTRSVLREDTLILKAAKGNRLPPISTNPAVFSPPKKQGRGALKKQTIDRLAVGQAGQLARRVEGSDLLGIPIAASGGLLQIEQTIGGVYVRIPASDEMQAKRYYLAYSDKAENMDVTLVETPNPNCVWRLEETEFRNKMSRVIVTQYFTPNSETHKEQSLQCDDKQFVKLGPSPKGMLYPGMHRLVAIETWYDDLFDGK
jgi:hypothetical protein